MVQMRRNWVESSSKIHVMGEIYSGDAAESFGDSKLEAEIAPQGMPVSLGLELLVQL
jgi:hypothetical protein